MKFLFITPQSGIYSTEVRHFAHRFSTILLIGLSYFCLSSGLSNTKSGIYSTELLLSFLSSSEQNYYQEKFVGDDEINRMFRTEDKGLQCHVT